MSKVIKFNTSAWMSDPSIGMCAPSTRGILIDLMCCMSDGEVNGTVSELSQLARCTVDELSVALVEFQSVASVVVSRSDDVVTVCHLELRRRYLADQARGIREWVARNRHRLVRILSNRDGYTCRGCGTSSGLQVDHIQPVSRGGANNLSNLQLLCGTCNRRKSAKWVVNA